MFHLFSILFSNIDFHFFQKLCCCGPLLVFVGSFLVLQESEVLKTKKESYQEKLEEYNARLKEAERAWKVFLVGGLVGFIPTPLGG